MKTFRWTFRDPPLSRVEQKAAGISLTERNRRAAEAKAEQSKRRDEEFVKRWETRRQRGMLKSYLIDLGKTMLGFILVLLFFSVVLSDPLTLSEFAIAVMAALFGMATIIGLGSKRNWRAGEKRYLEIMTARESESSTGE